MVSKAAGKQRIIFVLHVLYCIVIPEEKREKWWAMHS